MSGSDPAVSVESKRVWIRGTIGLVGILLSLGVAITAWITLGVARVSPRISHIQDQGEPVALQERTSGSPSRWDRLHDRAMQFRAAREANSPLLGNLAQVEAGLDHAETRAALGDHAETVEAFLRCLSDRWHRAYSQYNPWPAPDYRCTDPGYFDALTDCDRLELRSKAYVCEPLVSAAMAVCTDDGPAGAPDSSWLSTLSLQGDVEHLWFAVHLLVRTIPGLLLDGRPDVALQRLECAAHGATLLNDVPTVRLHATWSSCVYSVLLGCQFLIAGAPPGLNWEPVRMQMDGLHAFAHLENALLLERAAGIETFESMRRGTTPRADIARWVEQGWYRRMLILDHDFARYLDEMQWQIARARLPLPQSYDALEPWSDWTEPHPGWAQVSRFITPPAIRTYRSTVELEASLRLARAAIEAHEHGIAAGIHLASTLADPLGELALGARQENGVLLLWSCGWNRIDEGGSSEMIPLWCGNDPTTGGSRDIVWRVRSR